MKRALILAAVCIGGALAVPVMGQDSPAPAAPAPIPGLGLESSEMLGPMHSSQASGISLRPPAGSKTIRRAGGDTVVEFMQDAKKLNLRVTRTALTKPMKLSIPAAPNATNAERGMLEITLAQLQQNHPNHTILRQDIVPLAGHDAGIVIMRANTGVNNQFMQQAIIQANEQLYYTVAMSVPGQAPTTPADAKPDKAEEEAARIFRAVLDSVSILDQEKLRAEQDERLYRTRALFVNWNEAKLRSVLAPQQWLRVMRDGKDIGYSYIVEEPEVRGNNPGYRVGIRSRMIPKPGTQLDGETWYHISFDRKLENWTSLTFVTAGSDKYLATEFGSSQMKRKPVPNPNALGGGDPANPGVKLIDTYNLSVHRVTKKVTAPPVDRELPPYYLPQALQHLLPRLMPLGEPRGYLFASWVTNEAEVKLRYVDIGAQKDVTFNGQKLTVIPIVERVGYDGSPTTHYMSLEGKYLGSETVIVDDAGVKTVVAVIPTDAATLQGLWKNADLTAPSDKPANDQAPEKVGP